jgi:hypothetical protein
MSTPALNKDTFQDYLNRMKDSLYYIESMYPYFNEHICDNLLRNSVISEDLLSEWYLSSIGVDIKEWIDWFIHEIDFGRKPLTASIDNKKFLVDSFNVFWELLEEYSKKQ